MRRIAVLGAGHVGPVIARLALDAGFDVAIAASGSPENLELGPDAVAVADLVVLAIPLHRFPDLDPGLLAGKLVVDAMNYWAPADGVVPMFQGQQLSSSEIVQRRLSQSMVIKSLNQIAYQDLEDGRRPEASPDRHAIGVAGDDPRAAKLVAEVIDRFGYEGILLGSLSAGRVLQPGGPVFGAVLTRAEFERAIHTTAVQA
ncbi:MAG: NADP oxidoreductase [Chloroflexi bacterium]|nr:MAG: NADP oxidoreductase [Chloroflexota bacterium]